MQHQPECPAAASPARRSNADYRWTEKKVTAFLRALAACGKVAEAARSVGMSRKSAYVLKARLADARFQHAWALARQRGRAVRLLARRQPSPWGEAGLGALAHLRKVQGDTLPPQGDTPPRKVTF